MRPSGTPLDRLLLLQAMIADPHLTLADLKIASTIIEHYNHDRRAAWPSIQTLVTRTGLHYRTVVKSLRHLIGDGWFAADKGGGRARGTTNGKNTRYYPSFDRTDADPNRGRSAPVSSSLNGGREAPVSDATTRTEDSANRGRETPANRGREAPLTLPKGTREERTPSARGSGSPSPAPAQLSTRSSSAGEGDPNPSSACRDALTGDAAARALFGSCLAFLKQNNVAEARARALLGRWRRDFGNEAVIEACHAAEAEAVSEPVAWIIRALEARRRNGANGKRTAFQVALDLAKEHVS